MSAELCLLLELRDVLNFFAHHPAILCLLQFSSPTRSRIERNQGCIHGPIMKVCKMGIEILAVQKLDRKQNSSICRSLSLSLSSFAK
jgi:hypothetical protein